MIDTKSYDKYSALTHDNAGKDCVRPSVKGARCQKISGVGVARRQKRSGGKETDIVCGDIWK